MADAHPSHGEKRARSEPLLLCDQLLIGWHDVPLLPPIDVTVHRGELLAVVGRNGAGKSTWFKTLLGLTSPLGGRVVHCCDDLSMCYIPQSNALDAMLPLRARDVVMQGRIHRHNWLRPVASARDHEACAQALRDADAIELADERFGELSRGQRQRVFFARMLASEADLALLDEPTAAMDVEAQHKALEKLAEASHERNTAVVIISHALDLARQHADHILLLDRTNQRIVYGTRDDVVHDTSYLRLYRPSEGPPPP
jgi:zinc transport system ATP-binding protein